MMPLLGQSIVRLINAQRVVHIDGRLGGGKTALAYYLAHCLINEKWMGYRYIFSNCPDVWTTPLDKIEIREEDGEKFVDLIVILDEGGSFLQTSKDAQNFMIALRKLNICILVPSNEPPSNRIRKLTIERSMDMYQMGIPAWVYEYRYRSMIKNDQEGFWWLFPHEIFGVYNTQVLPVDDGGFNHALVGWLELVRKETEKGYRGRRGSAAQRRQIEFSFDAGGGDPGGNDTGVLGMEGGGGFNGDFESAEYLEAAEIIQETLQALPVSENRRRKRRSKR
jgi:hypothetical protein